MATSKTQVLFVRVPVETKKAFIEKAMEFDLPSNVHREIIKAYIEGRLIMTPPKMFTHEFTNEEV